MGGGTRCVSFRNNSANSSFINVRHPWHHGTDSRRIIGRSGTPRQRGRGRHRHSIGLSIVFDTEIPLLVRRRSDRRAARSASEGCCCIQGVHRPRQPTEIREARRDRDAPASPGDGYGRAGSSVGEVERVEERKDAGHGFHSIDSLEAEDDDGSPPRGPREVLPRLRRTSRSNFATEGNAHPTGSLPVPGGFLRAPHKANRGAAEVLRQDARQDGGPLLALRLFPRGLGPTSEGGDRIDARDTFPAGSTQLD
mmetsp:Transcript_35896/g.66116  ORF Transcript_35896/g.66116 Transcript_35896/m.66116 type:complete len:252 (+) Transcript_35896:1139-1894(+)